MKSIAKTKELLREDNSHLHGAAVIDSEGNEIPITEEMIQRALENLCDTQENSQINQSA